MKNKNFISFFLLMCSFNLNSTENNETCNLETYCNNCTFCGMPDFLDLSECNFDNIFCLENDSSVHFHNLAYINYYSYFRTKSNIDDICDKEAILITKGMNTKTVLKTNKINDYLKEEKINCNYDIDNSFFYNSSKDITISFKLISDNKENEEKNLIHFIIYVISSNSSESNLITINDEELRSQVYELNIVQYIKVYILIDFPKNQNTQEILEIKIKNGNYLKYMIIRVVISILVVIILLILIIICKKRRTEIREEQNIDLEKNKKKIELLFGSVLKPKPFSKNENFTDCSSCTICLEEFKENSSKVSITPCKHIFHYKCIKEWLDKNVSKPKCPNCNYNLLSYEIKSNTIDTKIINVENKNSSEDNLRGNS